MTNIIHCPGCGSSELEEIYRVENVPVHSVQLINSYEEAIDYPVGDIHLAFCKTCGFIFNAAFEPSFHDYAHNYESTQSYSKTFNAFADKLAQGLVDSYDLHGKTVLEIGCGQGEFIRSICVVGGNDGLGFDPALHGTTELPIGDHKIKLIKDFYSEKYSHYSADFICCKMTLEHIPNTLEFVSMVRRAIGQNNHTVVYFQVPDMTRILEESAFWDIYYEHCSYFGSHSLTGLFQRSGFEVMKLDRGYQNQYLMIEARPGDPETNLITMNDQDKEELVKQVRLFKEQIADNIARWNRFITDSVAENKKVVPWGGGSKAVAFLTTMNVHSEIKYAVDINPKKHGTFLAGTGQEVISPERLKEIQPDIVIAMNPIYLDDIKGDLVELGVDAQVIAV